MSFIEHTIMHDALFEYPDEYPDETGGVAPGHIRQVMKVGFLLNNRVVRPAEVGVVKASRPRRIINSQ
jgi:molecular chaperone GrpE